MSVAIGIVILGVIVWCSYGRTLRVLARKRYTTRTDGPPDLSRFAEESPTPNPKIDDPGRPRV